MGPDLFETPPESGGEIIPDSPPACDCHQVDDCPHDPEIVLDESENFEHEFALLKQIARKACTAYFRGGTEDELNQAMQELRKHC